MKELLKLVTIGLVDYLRFLQDFNILILRLLWNACLHLVCSSDFKHGVIMLLLSLASGAVVEVLANVALISNALNGIGLAAITSSQMNLHELINSTISKIISH